MLMNTPRRAVTVEDYERLALETPGAHVARASCASQFGIPDFPNRVTMGSTTVIALPGNAGAAAGPQPRSDANNYVLSLS